ncbi:hypothetical protein C2E25_10500 [Geothermobacter hydrogeniphilus]|uniref:Uncharacterized protein n=1 Tax=Geothermobacter hydrogeniphilus TaxID=1969733 RepID=A0A2K2H9E1_9BACT|nr:hypothetical protein [Geothermobacter hydrogeniphilus]PNU19853.1 hypothetical protein C2E25_10500 [Geothermobacter hydrogeniphilus]
MSRQKRHSEFYRQQLDSFLTYSGTTDTESIALWVGCPDCGWIDARLVIGDDSFFINFSDAYPPFLDLVDWITRITKGEDVGPVWVYDEIRDHFFNVNCTEKENVLRFEYARFYFPGVGVFRKSFVKRTELVSAFYLAFKYLMAIDFEAAEERDDSSVWFHFDDDSDDLVKFDLSEIEAYLQDSH